MSDTYAILLAAGRGTRFGEDKVTKMLGGRPLWRWSYDALIEHPQIDGVVVVIGEHNENEFDNVWTVAGGDSRQASVIAGMEALPIDARYAAIHDAARPFVSRTVLDELLYQVIDHDGVAPAIPVTDTVRRTGNLAVVDRESLLAMQTPQVVNARRYRIALDQADAQTDDLAVLQSAGMRVATITGTEENFKITNASDWARAVAVAEMMAPETQPIREKLESIVSDIAAPQMPEFRTGIGYDVHQFSRDASRPMMLGGVHFPDAIGLEGHSDADVVLHAVVDALLGAASLGDIGVHFPPTKPQWNNASSLIFLDFAAQRVLRAGWRIIHIDIAVIAETPKIMPRSGEIRSTIADSIKIDLDRVSIKATTNEGMGFVGRKEGIACHAVATIARP